MKQERMYNTTAGVSSAPVRGRMIMKRFFACILSISLMASLCTWAGAAETELQAAATFVAQQGIMVGDTNGDQHLDRGLSRAELAAILTRMCINPEHIAAEKDYYTSQCKFTDVPDWAKLYVGACAAHSLMLGYGDGRFGADDSVTPAAAATVMLRYVEHSDSLWDYSNACDTALNLGLFPEEAVDRAAVTRGDMAILIYRAMGNDYTEATHIDQALEDQISQKGAALSKNTDGSINPPSDGSQYVPQEGDVIRCDDGTNYTITDVKRWDKSMFASGPVGELPEPTCDWSLLEQPELPEMEVRRFNDEYGDRLFVRNLYETRRMLYTLYNAIGNNPETWENGHPKLNIKGIFPVYIKLGIPMEESFQVFWPWHESELVNLFNSGPPGTYSIEAWDVYSKGIFQHTRYNVRAI